MTESALVQTRIFQAHFADADYHIKRANELFSGVKASMRENPAGADQKTLGETRAHSRACILSVMGGLESLCNCLIESFSRRVVTDLPETWIPSRLKGREFEWWPLAFKLRFVPVVCSVDVRPPQDFFDERSTDYLFFGELVRVRNSLVHGRTVSSKYVIHAVSDNQSRIDDTHPENFWPITGFPRDSRALSYPEAEAAYRSILIHTRKLRDFLGAQVTRLYLRDDDLIMNGIRYNIQRESTKEYTPKWCRIVLGEVEP